MEQRSVENRLAGAALYVRSHLDEPLTLEAIAGTAGFSSYHFHRIFRVAFGENLNAYVVRHRLQRAAQELRESDRSITEIGLRCGYDSPSAFGRAFARSFKLTPSAFRASDDVRPYILATNVPVPVMVAEPRIERYAECEALGLRHVGPYDTVYRAMERLLAIASARSFLPAARIIGLSYDSPDIEEHEALRFDACVTIVPGADVAGARADGLRAIVLPGGPYAVFRHRGSYERITHAFDQIVSAWILTGRMELRDAPFVNTYLSNPARVAAADLECDLAIPIL